VAPYLLPTTRRFVEHTATLPGVKLGLITQEPEERIPPELREGLAAVEITSDALDSNRIADACHRIERATGPVERVLGALEELQVPLGEVRTALGLPGMDGPTARNFRDKARMKEVLRAHGLPCARHVRAKTTEKALAFVREVGFPVIVKPTAGSGSRDTFRVEDEEQLLEVLDLDGSTDGVETMIEEFITGQEHSFDSVFLGGRLVWHSVCHYFPRPLDIMENDWMQWCVVIPREADHPRYRDIRDVAERSLQALGMTNGLSHMEWFRRADGGLAISEVGARPPGAQFVTLISYAHGIDLYRAWAHLMVFDEFDAPDRPFAAGAAFLRAQGTGRKITAIRGAEEVVAGLRGLAVEVRLPAEGAPPRSGYEGDGYVIVRHPQTEVVEEALGEIVRNIRVELG